MICVDASVAVKLVLPEDHSREAEALVVAALAKSEEILAPALIHFQVTNAIRRNVVKRELSVDEAEQALERYLSVPIRIAETSAMHRRALAIANTNGLPAAYDAHYVALAEALGCDFWTDDSSLISALRGRFPFVKSIRDYPAA